MSSPAPEHRTRIATLDDGRLDLQVSKSWLETHDLCPERARDRLVNVRLRRTGKAAALGVAAHSAIEHALLAWQDQGAVGDLDVYAAAWTDAAHLWFDLWAEHGFENGGPISSMQHGANMLARIGQLWLDHALPHVHPDTTAWQIEEPLRAVLVDNDRWRISLVGVVDMFDGVCAWDWKTGRAKRAWEVERYDQQTTVYSLLCGAPRASLAFLPREHPEDPSIVIVERTDAHAAMLIAGLERIAAKAAHGLGDQWDIRPTGWHCSERWCDVYAAGECRGAYDELAIFPDERTQP